jgi:hypothetical protein
MRRKMLAAILFAVVFTVLAPRQACASVSWSVSISYFHETLAPYGRWVVSEPYGEVWVPSRISSGWDPYWNGEWIWTDYGWTWVSYDPWGDIPYHYGTWVWVDNGWAWEPGTVWAPAWVTWAWTDDYIGWAPVSSSFFITASGYSGPAVVVAPTRYVFVPATQFVGTNVSTVSVPQTQNAAILSRAQKGTRFTVSSGVVRATAVPPPSLVERVSGKRLERASLGKLKARPTTLAAAHVSGKRIPVVAPARERSAAIARAKTNTRQSKAARAARVREARVAGTVARAKPHGARMTRETRVRQRAASPARVRGAVSSRHGSSRSGVVHRTRGTALRHAKPTARREAVHRTRIHREAARSAPARQVSRRAEHTPGVSARPAHVSRHEVRHERAAPQRESHAPMSPPRIARAPAPQASSPRMHGNPHAAPPARAAQLHAQPPPQSAAQAPRGKEKEKKAGG